MMVSKNVQYGIVAALAVYVVFFTRPAPLPLVNLLSNPLAQLAVLGAVVYVGAKVSLLVALVAAVAVVMTIPSREFMSPGKKTDKPKSMKEQEKADEMAKLVAGGRSKFVVGGAAPNVPSEISTVAGASSAEPAPGADAVATVPETTGSEKFSLSDAAPF